MAVQPPADWDGDGGPGEDGGGQSAGDGGRAGVQVGRDRMQEHSEGVVHGAVADGLGDREGGDDPPAVEDAPGTATSDAGGGPGGGVAGQPQQPPLCCSAFVRATGNSVTGADSRPLAMPVASPRFTGAAVSLDVPQQLEVSLMVVASTGMSLLHTPVSGRSSWTSRAASQSPSRAATTERACSYPVASRNVGARP